MEQELWDAPARLIVSLNGPAFCGSLALCVLHFRDRLSPAAQLSSRITLEKGALDGKTWLGVDEVNALLWHARLPSELQSAY